jgi:ATP synthase I chain
VDGDSQLLRRVACYGWTMTGVLVLGALIAGVPRIASGCALGGAFSMLHFKCLALVLTAIVDPHKRPASRIKKLAFGAYFAKYFIIGGLVYLLFRYGVVEPLGFLGGLSVIFVAICLAGLQRSKPLRALPR